MATDISSIFNCFLAQLAPVYATVPPELKSAQIRVQGIRAKSSKTQHIRFAEESKARRRDVYGRELGHLDEEDKP
jgi:hypothetical protein